jgi:hypothetical protein
MAQAATYNVSTNRESLSDILTVLTPEATPFTSMAKKITATGTFNEVVVDDLSVASFDGVNEGEDVKNFSNKAEKRARIGNFVQAFRRTYSVSNIQELVDSAGVENELAHAESFAIRELKRDVECALCSNQDRQSDSGSGSPYKTRGMFKFLGDGGQPTDIPERFQSVASSTTNPQTETSFNSVLQSLYEANGMPGGQLTLIAGPDLKKEISDFSRQAGGAGFAYQVTQPAESKKITLTVNLYEGDFGTVAILPSTSLRRTSGSATLDKDAGLLIDPDYVGLHVLQAESSNELENQGGGRRGYADIICGLAVMSPKAHGFFN